MSHTPAPWFAHNLGVGHLGKGPYTYPLGTDPEIAADNARLIASAPEMLDALRLALPCVEAAEIALRADNLSGAAAKCLLAIARVNEAITKATKG